MGELIASQGGDYDFVASKTTVRRSGWQGKLGVPKSGKERTIPLNMRVPTALKRHQHLRGPWVYCESDGQRYNKDNFAKALKRICRHAGLRKIGWHTLRHTFASHLVMRGEPLKVVRELMGHASILTTMRYAHLSPDVERRAIDVLSTANQFLKGCSSGSKMLRSTGW